MTDPRLITQLIRSRRSVFPRQYNPQASVDDAIIREILENATWAPSHGNIQPWKFVVFCRNGREKLARFQAKVYQETAGDQFRQATYDNLLTNPLKASHIIALCMQRDPNRKFPEIEETSAVACAVQNMALTVAAYGLGAYWTTGGITYKEAAKPFLGLGEHDRLMGFLYIGVVATPSPEGKRAPLDEKVVWEEND